MHYIYYDMTIQTGVSHEEVKEKCSNDVDNIITAFERTRIIHTWNDDAAHNYYVPNLLSDISSSWFVYIPFWHRLLSVVKLVCKLIRSDRDSRIHP